jgi:hypothetical protein
MNTNETNIIIHDTIDADQIEDADQIRVDGTLYEDVRVENSNDPDEVRVRAYSEDTYKSLSLACCSSYLSYCGLTSIF